MWGKGGNMFKLKVAVSLLIILFSFSILTAEELMFYTQEFAPFSYSENSEVSGPAVEIIKIVCKGINVEPKFGIFPWRRAIEKAKEGDANALFVMGWNKPRTEWLYFSHPVIETEYGFFVQKNNLLEYKQPSDIEGYDVSVYGPSNTSNTLIKIAETAGNLEVDMTPDDESSFRKTDFGRTTGTFSNKDVGFAIIKKLGLKNLRYAGHYKKLNYYIGFLKANTEKSTVDKFNAKLKELTDSGEIQKILDKYGMQGVKIK